MSTAKKQEQTKHLTLVSPLPDPVPTPPVAEALVIPLPWRARIDTALTTFWANYSDNFFAFGMALFAAVLAIGEMLSSRYGGDNLTMVNEKNNMYMWYQSKGIKENITEGRMDFLNAMIQSGTVSPNVQGLFQGEIAKMTKEISRYKNEKKEILLGSKAVGEKGWTQEIDGKLGQIQGVKEIEANLISSNTACEWLERSLLLFQISLVFGAMGMMAKSTKIKTFSATMLNFLGILGTFFLYHAYMMLN